MNNLECVADSVPTALLHLLKEEVKPALGCTEPAAVALACAKAASLLEGAVCKIEIFTSEYILKNGMFVGIPNITRTGLDIAGALGAVIANPENGLMVLKGMSEQAVNRAQQLVDEGRVTVSGVQDCEKIYIRAVLSSDEHQVEATIRGKHAHFSKLSIDNRIIEEDSIHPDSGSKGSSEVCFTVQEAFAAVQEFDERSLEFLEDAITMNRAIAEDGLKNSYGLQVGKIMNDEISDSPSFREIASYATALTAGAADARMAGCEKAVMSLAGSGNQGLVSFLPVIAVAEKLKTEHLKTLQGMALSGLVTICAKSKIGRLSSLCGCAIAAAIGACSGIIYLYGGDYGTITLGIKNMVADISGMVCDGAKAGCALKIATSVESAFLAARMALKGSGASMQDGIVEAGAEDTLCNLGKLGNEGMASMNELVLRLMMSKSFGHKE